LKTEENLYFYILIKSKKGIINIIQNFF